jgi:hypothetical protein
MPLWCWQSLASLIVALALEEIGVSSLNTVSG